MNEELLNDLVHAANNHSVIHLGEELIEDTDIEDFLEDASEDQKLQAVIEYLQGTI